LAEGKLEGYAYQKPSNSPERSAARTAAEYKAEAEAEAALQAEQNRDSVRKTSAEHSTELPRTVASLRACLRKVAQDDAEQPTLLDRAVSKLVSGAKATAFKGIETASMALKGADVGRQDISDYLREHVLPAGLKRAIDRTALRTGQTLAPDEGRVLDIGATGEVDIARAPWYAREVPVESVRQAIPGVRDYIPPFKDKGIWAQVALPGTAALSTAILSILSRRKHPYKPAEGAVGKALERLIAKIPLGQKTQRVWRFTEPARYGALAGGATWALPRALMETKRVPAEKHLEDALAEEQRLKNAFERQADVQNQAREAQAYSPWIASTAGGVTGSLLGFFLTRKNRMLWSLAGGAAGSLAPLAILAAQRAGATERLADALGRKAGGAVVDKSVEKVAQAKEQPKDQSKDQPDPVYAERSTGNLAESAKDWAYTNRYSLGAGAAGAAAALLALKAYKSKGWKKRAAWGAGALGAAVGAVALAKRSITDLPPPVSVSKLRDPEFYPPIAGLNESYNLFNSMMRAISFGGAVPTKPEFNRLRWKLREIERIPDKDKQRREATALVRESIGNAAKRDPNAREVLDPRNPQAADTWRVIDMGMRMSSEGAGPADMVELNREVERWIANQSKVPAPMQSAVFDKTDPAIANINQRIARETDPAKRAELVRQRNSLVPEKL
jgi:hypothetical protein